MANTIKYVDDLNTIVAKVTELDRLLNAGELGFKLNEVLLTHASLFNRFCPYKVGDRIQLKESLDIPEGHGWHHYRHFLIKGAIATVKETGYRDDLFVFGVMFDDESLVHYRTGEIIPAKDNEKHLFYLSENNIEELDPHQIISVVERIRHCRDFTNSELGKYLGIDPKRLTELVLCEAEFTKAEIMAIKKAEQMFYDK